jgi:phosphopantothenoylcysteine synthetase/decarboxylase
MKAIVTCGPSYEPIDQVRRLTNFSTGELGTILSVELASQGWEVVCCRGEGSTAAPPIGKGITVETFATNADLEKILRAHSSDPDVRAVLHGAALSDFRVERITDNEGNELKAAKITSSLDRLTLVLEPAGKILAELRPLYPQAAIVGWKYELEGDAQTAVARAQQQARKYQIDASILNGSAYGSGFGFCQAGKPVQHFYTKKKLSVFLVEWLKDRGVPDPSTSSG